MVSSTEKIKYQSVKFKDEMDSRSTPEAAAAADKIIAFRSIIVHHRQYNSALLSVLDALRTVGDPPHSAMLIGAPGVGKTFMLSEIKKSYEIKRNVAVNGQGAEIDELPVAALTIPTTATVKATLQTLCARLDQMPPARMSVPALERLFFTLLEKRRVRLVVFDEAQNLRGRSTEKQEVKDLLRNVPEVTKIPMLLAGNEEALSLLPERSIYRRFRHVKLLPTRWETDGAKDFVDFATDYMKRSPFGPEVFSIFSESSNLLRLFIQTGGYPSDVSNFLVYCVTAHLAMGTERILQEHLDYARKELADNMYFRRLDGFDDAWCIPDSRLGEYRERIQVMAQSLRVA
jgi:hypothetical protein